MHKFRNRLMIFFTIMIILMVALVGRLVYIHVFWSDELTQLAKEQQNKNIVVPAKRGDILDRNGDKMAFSIKTYSIWASAFEITKPVETAELISQTLSIEYEPIVSKILSASTGMVKVVTDLTKSEADLIRGKSIRGISITEDTKRVYPYGNLASHLIGNVNTDNDGFLGLELYYNTLLKGEPGLYNVTTDVYGRQLAYGEENITAPENGNSILLTLDDSIQYFVEQRLETALLDNDALSVSAIVMDPKTGEILAMASKPDFNLNTPREYREDMDAETWAAMTDDERITYWYGMWKNTVLSNTYEPGSTFKAITAAIALEENLVRMDDHFFCSGLIYVKGVPLHCWKFPGSHGDQTFIEAFVNSCNPSFVEIGQRIGESTFYEYIEKFGYTETTGIDLPSEANSITLPLDRVGPIELATLSYGHGINVTMLQMTRVISALVNGGTLMKPQLVKEIYDEEGNLLQSFEPIFEDRIISEDTSEKMRVLFEAAVQTGGGRNAYIEGISVGGKSGTTKKVVGSEYEDNVVISSFVGIAPMESPEFVILVTIDEPKNEVQGSTVVAPVVKSILEDILRYKNIIPDVKAKGQVSVPDLKGKTLAEAIKSLAALDLRYSTEPMNIEDETVVIIDQFPKFGTEVEKNAIIILSVEE